MICIKCQEEIYNYKICPFCNHNQDDPVIEIKTEENQEPVKKSCETCNKTYSSYDKECQLCEVTKEKLEQIQQQEEERAIKKQENKKKTIKLIVISLCISFVLGCIFICSSIFLIAKQAAEEVGNVMAEQLQYFENSTGQISDDLLKPIDKEVAKNFVENIQETHMNLQIQFLELRYALQLFNDYQNVNLLQKNCETINKEIKKIYSNFDDINTYNDPLLEGAKQYTYDKLVKPYYIYINQVSSAGMKLDAINMNNATLEIDKKIAIAISANANLIYQKGGMTETESEEFTQYLNSKMKGALQKYLDILDPEEKKLYYDNLN